MKHNKFAKLIEMILVSLPLIYVGGVGAYTIFNKNAKDSYSSVDYVNETKLVDGQTLLQGQSYSIGFNGKTSDYIVSNQTINVVIGSDNIRQVLFPDETWVLKSFSFTFEGTRQRLIIYDTNNVQHNYFNMFIINPNLVFHFIPSNDYTFVNYSSQYINYFSITYTNSKLDYALPYAMSEFNKLGFGKINFVGWFVDLFMTGNTNNVYVTFINSYLNYFLFAEVCYFIPMIFYWFIHFGERVIDRFSRKEY